MDHGVLRQQTEASIYPTEEAEYPDFFPLISLLWTARTKNLILFLESWRSANRIDLGHEHIIESRHERGDAIKT